MGVLQDRLSQAYSLTDLQLRALTVVVMDGAVHRAALYDLFIDKVSKLK